MTNLVIGFLSAGVSVLCFGTNFIPVKQYDTGDGMFFQWAMCIGIWINGVIVHIIRYLQLQSLSPTPTFHLFEPFAMIGGALWCTGNIMAVPVIQCIGLGLGLLLWSGTNLFVGWACAYFGLLGDPSESSSIKSHPLNITGVCLAMVSVGLMFFIKTETTKIPPSLALYQDDSTLIDAERERHKINIAEAPYVDTTTLSPSEPISHSWVDSLSPSLRRTIGIVLAILSGCFYGCNFNPPNYLIGLHQDNIHSPNGVDYVFSHFSGILLTSTFYFLLYCCITKNKPFITPQLALPSYLSGTVWSFAQIGWFVANSELETAVSFPIISSGPGIVAALLGVFVFGEIKGRKNFAVLALAIVITLSGCICIGMSMS